MKKSPFLFTIILLGLFSSAFAASPAILYYDLTSGPKTGGQNNKGVFVTIWGRNFGATKGTSYVSIGGGQADNYPVWSDTKISFQLGTNAATGNITITTVGETSNGVSFTVRNGNIYFVSTSGSDSANGSYTTPWRTWQYAENHISAGDTVYGRGGSYITAQDVGENGHCFGIDNTGTEGNPIAFVAYPGETPILYPAGGNRSMIGIGGWPTGVYYLTISQLHLYNPAAGETLVDSITTDFYSDNSTNHSSHYRIVGNVAKKNFLGSENALSGAMTFCNGTDIYIAGNQISDVGDNKQEHGLYINEACTDVIIEYNEIFDIHNGYGIELYDDYQGRRTNCIIRNNLIYRTGRSGIQVGCPGTYKLFNNMLWDCARVIGGGIKTSNCDGTTTVEVYNNVFYDNGENELSDVWDTDNSDHFGQIEINNYGTLGSLTIRNNIVYSLNANEPYYTRSYTGGTQVFSNNLYYGNGGKPAFDNGTSTLNVNPQLSNPTSDFKLPSGSPAINAGYDTSATVTKDYDGIARPQSTGVDMGAYEYASDTVAPAKVDDLACGTVTASTIALTWIAPGNDGDSGKAASYDIRYSSENITDANWVSATQVSNEPSPSSAGTVEIFTITGFSPSSEYYFALKTSDYANNTSPLSNVVSGTTSALGSLSGSMDGGGGGGGGGGCFIATTVYGSEAAPEVIVLKRFRDNYLMKSKIGKLTVAAYYKISPSVAQFIKDKKWIKITLKEAFKPLLWVLRIIERG